MNLNLGRWLNEARAVEKFFWSALVWLLWLSAVKRDALKLLLVLLVFILFVWGLAHLLERLGVGNMIDGWPPPTASVTPAIAHVMDWHNRPELLEPAQLEP